VKRGSGILTDAIDSEWMAFIKELEAAEEEFVRGHPAAFQALRLMLMM
jgi:hypothetical protein